MSSLPSHDEVVAWLGPLGLAVALPIAALLARAAGTVARALGPFAGLGSQVQRGGHRADKAVEPPSQATKFGR